MQIRKWDRLPPADNGRDTRPAFKAAVFKEEVETLNDLAPGMILESVVTNVAAFGAFVDVGVHQDGLVHVSAMARTFVKDPRSTSRAGQSLGRRQAAEADRVDVMARRRDRPKIPADARNVAARADDRLQSQAPSR